VGAFGWLDRFVGTVPLPRLRGESDVREVCRADQEADRMKAKRFILRDKGIRDNALEYIRNLPSDTVWQIVISKWTKPRSDNQHGYYRVLVDIVSEHTGYTTDELHDMFRTKAGLWKTVNGVEVLRSTKELSVIEMGELIETVLRVAATDLEISLPAPSQVWAA
jgi:hypothetical protein